MKDLTATGTKITKEMRLQMTVKTVNDTAGDNGLILTLLMFDAYLRMQKFDFLFSIIIQKADAIKKTMKKMRITKAQKQISDALNTRNESITDHFHDLSLNLKILI